MECFQDLDLAFLGTMYSVVVCVFQCLSFLQMLLVFVFLLLKELFPASKEVMFAIR